MTERHRSTHQAFGADAEVPCGRLPSPGGADGRDAWLIEDGEPPRMVRDQHSTG